MSLAQAAIELIEKATRCAVAPVVAWSGGLDSQVLLHLAHRVQATMPVFWARPEHQPRVWQDDFIVENNLEVWRTRPYVWSWLSDGHDVDLIGAYHVGQEVLVPILFEVAQSKSAPCVFDLAEAVAPMALHQLPFDVVLSGQRIGEADGWGNVIERLNPQLQAGDVQVVCPLRDWSRDDVVAYANEHGLRQGVTSQDGQRVSACVQCVTGNGAKVFCPKKQAELVTPVSDYQSSLDAWRRIMEKNNNV